MRKHISTIIAGIIFLTGLSLLLYPTISNFWNSKHQTQAVADYSKQIEKMDDQEEERPESIVVELLQMDVEGNTTVVDRQTLTKENQWSYTWKNLSAQMRWSVSEAEVPKGYTVAVTREGNTVVLTNTAKKPGKSDGEVNPPSKRTTGKTTDKTSDKLPQTGQLWWPVIVLLFAGAICLLVGRVLRDRKEEKN